MDIKSKDLSLFEYLFKNAQIGLIYTDRNRDILKANPRLAEIFGYDSAQEIIGLNMLSLHLNEEKYIEFAQKNFEFLTQKVSVEVEYPLRRKDGSIIWCLVTAKAPDSTIPTDLSKGTLWSVIDISKLKETQKQLELSTERWNSALNANDDGVWEWDVETNNLFVSDRWKIMHGFYIDDVIDSLDQWNDNIHPEDKIFLGDSFKNVLSGTIDRFVSEYRWKGKDGVYKWILDRGVVVEKDDKEKPKRLIGTHHDISLQKSYEFELIKSRDTAQHYLDIAGNLIIALDTKGNVTLINSIGCDILEGSESDIVGKNWFESFLVSDELNTGEEVFLKLMAASVKSFEFEENQLKTMQGNIKLITWRNSLIYDENGDIQGLLASGKDITKERELKIEAESKEQFYSQLFKSNGAVMLLIDPLNNGKILDANEASQTFYGYDRAELTNMSIKDLNTLSSDEIDKEMQEAIKEEREYFHFIHKIKSGELRNVKVFSGVLRINESDILYSIIFDITKEYKLEEELKLEKDRFQLAIEGAKDALWDWNLRTDELFFSERFETMLGYKEGDLPKAISTYFGLLHPDDKESVDRVHQEYLDTKGKGSYENSFRLRMKDGSWKWILGRGKAQFDKDGKPLRFVGFNTDISQQKEYQDKLNHTAKHDLLTQLPNRFLLSELLTHAMDIVKKNHKRLVLLFIDLDGFKEINDVYGHDSGDEVLSVVASRMKDIVRKNDIVSRLGGDEFVIVITDLNQTEEVIPLIQRLLGDLSLNIKHNEHNMHISASIGVSCYPQSTDIGNEVLLRQADQAMYTAKLSGKNQYKFFNIEASDELKENQQNITSFREAITKNQLVLYYQPKVDMKNNKVIGFEALLRWNHPQKGLLFPDDFLPLIEKDSSLMIELGKWVFENAFSELESWHAEGLDIMLNINVSSHEIQEENFSLYLKKLFDKHQGIKTNTIEIELLETAAFDNFELSAKTLKECQELGLSVAIDDFGTGYASLKYLKNLPMNTLKIDKSFVIDILHTSSSISIIEASLGLAHAFNVNTVAEGVESEEHGKILLQLGCTIAQGYGIAKAMPANNVKEWLASYKGFSSWAGMEPVNEEQRIILYASIEHRSWIYSIESFIKNKNKNLPKLDESSCYLGKWLKSSVSKKYLVYPEYVQLQALHTQLHHYAEDLLLLNENEKLVGIDKLKSLRHEILKNLELLTTLAVDT